jgi:hypothetical protein
MARLEQSDASKWAGPLGWADRDSQLGNAVAGVVAGWYRCQLTRSLLTAG